MNKIVSLYLSRRDVPTRMDVVQGATAPGITFILEDYEPNNGAQAQIFIKKKESEVYNACTLEGNTVTFSPSTGTFDEAGECQGQLQITSGGTIAVSYRLFIKVEPNIIDGEAIEASDDFSALQQAIIDVGDMTEWKAQVTQNTSDIEDLDALIYRDGNETVVVSGSKEIRFNSTDGLVTIPDRVLLPNSKSIQMKGSDDTIYNIMALTNTDALEIGHGLWNPRVGKTNLRGEEVNIITRTDVNIAGRSWANTNKSLYAGSSPDNQITSLPNEAWTVVGSITVPAGLHFISLVIRCNNNANGRREMILSSNNTADDSGQLSVAARDSCNPVPGTFAFLKMVGQLAPASETTYYIKAYQNSGSALTIAPRVTVIQLR